MFESEVHTPRHAFVFFLCVCLHLIWFSVFGVSISSERSRVWWCYDLDLTLMNSATNCSTHEHNAREIDPSHFHNILLFFVFLNRIQVSLAILLNVIHSYIYGNMCIAYVVRCHITQVNMIRLIEL